ncbi:beta-galactosidase [Leifsonia sp. LS1]|uniref:glycoside hydrolase family 2 protein n=1 Tax=Leifsonia sp. LS1 TaxID=2828483 RepID=UPI00208CE014|nr:glycoside hydrolase family 2 TIM barrel-domain containing protein [Leifsonia sp. LS1]GIT79034.1 beta-galactosidase [Leifsonia sp. LS1]
MSGTVDGSGTAALRASRMETARPRPQLLRASFRGIDGDWGFGFDDDDRGLVDGWADGRALPRTITVPFPPESVDSGINDTGYHPIVWYRRELAAADLTAAGHVAGNRLLVHFGAVDHQARVWVDGQEVGRHTGGHTPFTVDVTDALDGDSDTHALVVRAEDDPHDIAQPRGKQDWRESPHSIWYHRTTGIWQPVWLESVRPQHVTALWWTSDQSVGTVTVEIELSRRAEAAIRVVVAHGDRILGSTRTVVNDTTATVTLPLAGQGNGQEFERLLWSPASPTLLDAWVHVDVDGVEQDVVASYLGLRSVRCTDGAFLLNERPLVLRSVLSQGYWPDSHLAAPSGDALRREAELIGELGFNAVRVHQKVEDDRFLYWADRLGLLVWGEMPATYAFDNRSVRRTIAEWGEAVLRDRSHPSIVTWVPLNESWGVQHIAARPDQRAFAEALYQLTRALDPTRPVISNDGWELGTSDLWTLHDYEPDGDVLRRRYAVDDDALRTYIAGIGPAGRRIRLPGTVDDGQPIMLTEFGGVAWAADESPADSWGYSEAVGPADYAERVTAILTAVQASTRGHRGRPDGLAGWCWTQLTDTMQERNGLLTERREPKLPLGRLRALISGDERTAAGVVAGG